MMEESSDSSPKEEESSNCKQRHDLNPPERNPFPSVSILPQSMPLIENEEPRQPPPHVVLFDPSSSRGHSSYEYGQPGFASTTALDQMYPYSSSELQDSSRGSRSGNVVLPSTPVFSSSSGAFSTLSSMDSSSAYRASTIYPVSPLFTYGSSGPSYSGPTLSSNYHDPYTLPYNIGSSASLSSYASARLSTDSSHRLYHANIPTYPYGQPFPEQYQRIGLGRSTSGSSRHNYSDHNRRGGPSYAISPGPPIVQPGIAKGPEGANLFIFHIPNDFTNQEMYDMFSEYGNVLSARIMVEAHTGRSRGFGFVSFDSTESAANAIKHLNGYPIKGKRLKVQYKQMKSQDPLEPYSYYPQASSVPIQQYTEPSDFFPSTSPTVRNAPFENEGDALSFQQTRRGTQDPSTVLPLLPPPTEDEKSHENRTKIKHSNEHGQITTLLSSSPLSDLKDIGESLPDPWKRI